MGSEALLLGVGYAAAARGNVGSSWGEGASSGGMQSEAISECVITVWTRFGRHAFAAPTRCAQPGAGSQVQPGSSRFKHKPLRLSAAVAPSKSHPSRPRPTTHAIPRTPRLPRPCAPRPGSWPSRRRWPAASAPPCWRPPGRHLRQRAASLSLGLGQRLQLRARAAQPPTNPAMMRRRPAAQAICLSGEPSRHGAGAARACPSPLAARYTAVLTSLHSTATNSGVLPCRSLASTRALPSSSSSRTASSLPVPAARCSAVLPAGAEGAGSGARSRPQRARARTLGGQATAPAWRASLLLPLLLPRLCGGQRPQGGSQRLTPPPYLWHPPRLPQLCA
jgi:hypothetical protein